MLIQIKLQNAEWSFDDTAPLGPPGGFGEVFEGEGSAGPVAIKRLKINAAAAAHRELDIGAILASRELDHVVPVLDFGQDALSDRYFLVMPICDRSLQDDLDARGSIPLGEARQIAVQILHGLREVGDVVHRDLKPGNVLFYNGRWRIADFGIAKFVEDSTSLETLRDNLTPAYGAPEQWAGGRPSKATDVYALGCIFHAMLTGRPPFVGSLDDIREGHLRRPAPPLAGTGDRLAAFIAQMLRKPSEARPTVERCITVFDQVEQQEVRPALAGLAAAASHVAARVAAEEAERAEQEALDLRWTEMVDDASRELGNIVSRFIVTVREVSEHTETNERAVRLGDGAVAFGPVSKMGREQAKQLGWADSGWTIGAWTFATVRCYPTEYTWGATICFASTRTDPSFRWREVAFYNWHSGSTKGEPLGINPAQRDFHLALSNIVSAVQLAVGPTPIDGEDEASFHERWVALLTKAAMGKLSRPNQMPVPPTFYTN